MRISTKGRYALAAAICMAQQYNNGEYITVVSISKKLGISKIYLEQVFSLLKRGGLVTSIKGAQGGYLLTRRPSQITVYDILTSVEGSLFEKTEKTVSASAPAIETAMRENVFKELDITVKCYLMRVTLEDLMVEAENNSIENSQMFSI